MFNFSEILFIFLDCVFYDLYIIKNSVKAKVFLFFYKRVCEGPSMLRATNFVT